MTVVLTELTQNKKSLAHNKELAKYTEHASPFSHSTEELAILALVKRLSYSPNTLTRFCFKGKTIQRTCENGPCCTSITTTSRVK
jgi:hypothetical protein